VQVNPIKPTLKAPGTQRLILKRDVRLSNVAFKINLSRYTTDATEDLVLHWGVARDEPGQWQGLTLDHFSAQRERFLYDKGCSQGLLRVWLGSLRRYQGVSGMYILSESAQVELKSGRV